MDETVASTHLNLAEAWMGQGEIDYAMTEYGRALELDADILTSSEEGIIAQVATPQQRARVAYLIARAYARRGNLDGALDSLRKAAICTTTASATSTPIRISPPCGRIRGWPRSSSDNSCRLFNQEIGAPPIQVGAQVPCFWRPGNPHTQQPGAPPIQRFLLNGWDTQKLESQRS